MNMDFATDLDLCTLAVESGCSTSHFIRIFRASMGVFAAPMPVEAAGGTGEDNIARKNAVSLVDIALACGFSSHAHFSNAFRQIVGSTPGDYRRSHGPNMKKGSVFASNSLATPNIVLGRQNRTQQFYGCTA